MITVIAKTIIKDSYLEEALRIYKELVDKTRLENGCISYELFQELDDNNRLTLIEKWDNPKALQAHKQTAHFITLLEQLSTMKLDEPVLIYKQIF